jgi:hypothetical protein
MNLFGLPHFEQVGGGVFLAMGRLALVRAGAQDSLSPITADTRAVILYLRIKATK